MQMLRCLNGQCKSITNCFVKAGVCTGSVLICKVPVPKIVIYVTKLVMNCDEINLVWTCAHFHSEMKIMYQNIK